MTSPEIQARHAMSTGYVPIHKSALELDFVRDFLDKDPRYKVSLDQIITAGHARPISSNYPEFQDEFRKTMEQVIMGGIDPQKACDDFARKANTLLQY